MLKCLLSFSTDSQSTIFNLTKSIPQVKTVLLSGSLLIFCLIGIQCYWFNKAFVTADRQFDHTVSIALHAAADSMSDHAIIEKLSSNYYYISTNCRLSKKSIDSLVRKEFLLRNLNLDYEIGVYNAEDDSLIHGNYVKASEKMLPPESFPENQYDHIDKNFAVRFPGKQSHIAAELDIWIFSSFVLLIMSGYFYYAFRLFKSSNLFSAKDLKKISIGHSILDFHNQFLEVNDTTIRLTYKENMILKLLFENPNQVIEREVFLRTIWENEGFFVARSMDVFISKLRKYLSDDQSISIENLRSIGYRLHVINK